MTQSQASSASVVERDADDDIEALARSIDISSPLSIQNFGKGIAARSADYADELLAAVRASDLDETGLQLGEIVATAQKFNLNALDNALTRTPVIGALFKGLALSRQKAIARFDSIKGQVDRLVAQIETTAQLLEKRNTDYHAMYESVGEEQIELGRHARAIALRLADVEAEMHALDGSDGMDAAERVAALESAHQQLSKRADDLRVLQHAALQTLPMIRIIQSNNLTLLDKFHNIQQLTLPAWKRSFMLALTLDEQKNAVSLARSIDDATNAMMRRNAELLHENSVATARSNQRLVVDVDTLRDVHAQILATLTEVRREHEQGRVKRREAIEEIGRLRLEMAQSLKAIEARHA